MRILMATAMGIGSASAGFAAGMVGTIVVGPWTGTAFPALNMGMATGLMAMLGAFVLTLKSQRD